jgi:DNA-binding NarL/FixJ family response regulator
MVMSVSPRFSAVSTHHEVLERLAQLWRLTPRQREVLEELAQGLSNKEIALELGCSPNTIEVHVGDLLRKSGLGGRRSLMLAVLSG